MKKTNRRGFTLMEMLIVVAIIAILIAIAIPVFTNTLEKARETADLANIRSAYGEAMIKYLDGEDVVAGVVTVETPVLSQTVSGWDHTGEAATNVGGYNLVSRNILPIKGQKVSITIDQKGEVNFSVIS